MRPPPRRPRPRLPPRWRRRRRRRARAGGAEAAAADSAVIIRRGDTLWRISRRVYGRGVRYSTIYLANQDQIRDPDRIWPGQVFKVPEKSKEGEDADLKAMGDQMTTPPAKTN